MIKKQQKWIALFVVLTFTWLLQVSTMPLVAAGSTEQAGIASAEQGPDFVEAVKHKAAPAPKKSILPYVLIGLGVVAVAAVLFLVVLKSNYDIVGTWIGTEVYNGSIDYKYVFSGDKKSGAVKITHTDGSGLWEGTYTVDGKNVVMTVGYYSYAGAFDSKTTIKGDVSYYGEKYATFSMTKQ